MGVYDLSWVGDNGWAGVGDGFYQLQTAYGLTPTKSPPSKIGLSRRISAKAVLLWAFASIIDGLYRTFPASPRRSMPLQRRAPGSSGPPTANRPLTN